MENRKNLLAIIVILAIAFAITLGAWIVSSKELADIRNGDVELTQFQDSLIVCENIKTKEQEASCVKQLKELSALLSKYTSMLKAIEIPKY